MAYEFATEAGVVRLNRSQRRWSVRFEGREVGRFASAEAAAQALAREGLPPPAGPRARFEIPADLLDWRPIGESL